MASPKAAAKAHAAKILSGHPVKPARRRRSPKGRLFALAKLRTLRFRRSLGEALNGLGADVARMGLKSEAELREVLIEAHRRLEGGTKKITATSWLGKSFEIIGGRHPLVRKAEAEVLGRLLDLVNAEIANGGRRLAFLNGYLEPAGVHRPFGKAVAVHDVWIRRPGQARGGEFVDRGLLFFNDRRQALFVSTEFKTRGAAGELPGQTARRDPRLLDARHPENTKLAYTVEGESGVRDLDLENVILIGPNSPALLRRQSTRTRTGVRAGAEHAMTVALDANGEPYVRITVPVHTDSLRRTLERVLRDRSWQK